MARPRNYDKDVVNLSVEKACQVIDLFDLKTKTLSMKEIADHFHTTPSTILPILRSLEAAGYLFRDETTKKYRLGLRFLEIGNLVVCSMDIKEQSEDILTDLSYKYSVSTHLGILDGKDIVYIFRNCPVIHSLSSSYVGRHVPAYCTALGKAILAFSDENTQNRFMEMNDFQRITPNTIADADTFREELNSIRKKGFSCDNEEFQLGGYCIGTPIYDCTGKVCGAISFSLTTVRKTSEMIETVTEELCKAAQTISERLGYQGMKQSVRLDDM